MITDHAVLVYYAPAPRYNEATNTGETMPQVPGYNVIKDLGNGGVALAVPQGEPRYRMSPAQVSLLSLGYGVTAEATQSWEGMEAATAQFCALRLWAMRGSTLGELVHMFDAGVDVSSPRFSQPSTYAGVAIVRIRTKFEGTGKNEPVKAVLLKVRDLIARGYAVVIVNGPTSSHADVIIVTGGLVVLTQCKYYRQRTAFTSDAFVKELIKMGYFSDADAATQLGTIKSPKTVKSKSLLPECTAPTSGRGMTIKLAAIAKQCLMPSQVADAPACTFAQDVFVLFEFITTKPPIAISFAPLPSSDGSIMQMGSSRSSLPSIPVSFPRVLNAKDEGDLCIVLPSTTDVSTKDARWYVTSPVRPVVPVAAPPRGPTAGLVDGDDDGGDQEADVADNDEGNSAESEEECDMAHGRAKRSRS